MTDHYRPQTHKLPFGVSFSESRCLAKRGDDLTPPMALEVFYMARQAFRRHPKMVTVEHVRAEWRAKNFAPCRSPFEVARDVKSALQFIGFDLVEVPNRGWIIARLVVDPPTKAPSPVEGDDAIERVAQ